MALITDTPYHKITDRIIACAIRVHEKLGPGLLEEPYGLALAVEMAEEGLRFVKEKRLPVIYNGKPLGSTYVMDFVVEDMVVLEIKAVSEVLRVHRAQVLTYLKLSGYPAGLLINFNVMKLVEGVTRVLNDKVKAPKEARPSGSPKPAEDY